jgi:hypothetical protein
MIENKLEIGSIHEGGIVFYIDETGNGGLVCAEKDFGKVYWGEKEEIGAKGAGIADNSGMQNTMKIVELASPKPTAARLCIESNHNGYTDWYLPTKDELKLMYTNLHGKGLGGFISAHYWSSTEALNYSAFLFHFGDGKADNRNKGLTLQVRAIRTF